MSQPILLLDGASMWFRSYFGVPSSITAPDGRPVNAVRGFIDNIAALVTQHRPGRLVVCLDLDWRPQWRVDLIPSYKAHRVLEEHPDGEPDIEEVPDDLTPQVAMIMELLDAFGIATAGAAGFEADFRAFLPDAIAFSSQWRKGIRMQETGRTALTHSPGQ